MAKIKIGMKKSDMKDLETLFLAGVAKSFIEPTLAGFIGNATTFSGAVKLAGGFAVGEFLGDDKLSQVLKTALFVDGVEDIVYSIFSGNLGIGNIGGGSGIGGEVL
jgi:hypothetical protein